MSFGVAVRLIGFALISHCLIGQELVLTRLFSATIAYYFAFLAVSLALVGLGSGAMWVHIKKDSIAGSSIHAGNYAICCAVAFYFALACYLALYPFVDFGTIRGIAALAGVSLVFAISFFFAGVTVALLLHAMRERAGWAYGADLTGAAIGAVSAIILMERLPAHAALLWLSVGIAVAGSTYYLAERSLRRLITGIGICIVLVFAAIYVFPRTSAWQLQYARGKRMDKILLDSWNSVSRITLHHRSFGHWGQPHINPDPVPPQLDFRIDGSAETAITQYKGHLEGLRFLERDLDALPFWVLGRSPEKVLVLGSGGGNGVWIALLRGSKSVSAVEINPLIPKLLYQALADFSGPVYRQPHVELDIENARTFVRRDKRTYDIVTLTYVDTLASTSGGAYALTENYLYTVEAFRDFLSRVAPQGIFAFLRTRTRLPADDLKATLLAREALRKSGIEDPRGHIIIVGTWATKTRGVTEVLVKKELFTANEVEAVRQFAKSNGFDILYIWGAAENHQVYAAAIDSADPGGLIANYPVDIETRSDDSPFFFFNLGESREQNTSVLVLPIGLAILILLAFIFLWLIPHSLHPKDTLPPWPFLKLFAALGLGFMLVEFVVMQRFILLLGHPTWSLASTLVGLLLSAAIGSLFSARIVRNTKVLGAILMVTAGIILAANLIQPWLINETIRLSLTSSFLIVALLVLPIGFFLGMPVPSSMRLMNEQGQAASIPWAWAANGFFSVLGSIGAVSLGIIFGFRSTLLIGTLCYLAAALIVFRMAQTKELAAAGV